MGETWIEQAAQWVVETLISYAEWFESVWPW